MAEVEFLGADKLIARLIKLAVTVDPASVKGVKKVAYKIKDTARALVRVDTGTLQKSIRVGSYAMPAKHVHSIRVTAGGYVKNPKTGKIVDYAVPQEFGTSKMLGQPYMGPAVERHGPELTREIRKEWVKK